MKPIHVDPAHPAFARLPREQQAQIYHHYYGWSVVALREEFSASGDTVKCWIDPEFRAHRIATKAAYRNTEHGRQIIQDSERRRGKRRREYASQESVA